VKEGLSNVRRMVVTIVSNCTKKKQEKKNSKNSLFD
jgi:hypothetical protein